MAPSKMRSVFHTRSLALNILFTGTLVLAPSPHDHAGAQEETVVDPEHAELHRALFEDLEGMQFDLNRASAADLEALPWLSRGLIGKIVAHRERNGPFRRLGQLLEVPGMSPEALEAVRAKLKEGSVEEISEASEKLKEVAYRLSTRLYQEAGGQGGPQPGPDGSGAPAPDAGGDDDVIDAEYESK